MSELKFDEMDNHEEEREGGGVRKWQIVLLSVLLLLLLVLGTLFLFRVNEVTVSGNYHNSDNEVREMVMQGPLAFNTLFLKMANAHKKVEGETFIDSLHVEMKGLHKINIAVTEKDLIGYVSHDDRFWYFDREGIVRICSEKDESAYAALMEAEEAQAAAMDTANENTAAVVLPPALATFGGRYAMVAGEITPEEVVIAPVEIVDEAGEAVTPIIAEGPASTDEAAQETTAEEAPAEDTPASEASGESEASAPETEEESAPEGASGLGVVGSYKNAGSYIPYVEGLSFSTVAVGEVLPVKNRDIFASLETLKVYVNKNKGMMPDQVTFDETWNLILMFQDAKVNVGSGNYVGRRLEQLGGIYTHIAGLYGTLHLENYDGSQERLIFTRE